MKKKERLKIMFINTWRRWKRTSLTIKGMGNVKCSSTRWEKIQNMWIIRSPSLIGD